MHIGINPNHFLKAAVWEAERTVEEAIALVKDAGFRHLDLGTLSRQEAETLAPWLQENGMTVIQSHIPFNRYAQKDYALFKQDVAEAAENARILGSKILVVHGDEFDFAGDTYTREKVLEFNYAFFSDTVEFAVQNGMRVAFENVFEEGGSKPRFCSLIEDLCELVDKFNTDTVGICWDSGHGKVQYGDRNAEALQTAGSRVIATHIHDNYYGKDLHCFPFMGDNNWQQFMQTLGQIGYKGDLTFELVYDRLPNVLAPDYLKLLYRSGEYLKELM